MGIPLGEAYGPTQPRHIEIYCDRLAHSPQQVVRHERLRERARPAAHHGVPKPYSISSQVLGLKSWVLGRVPWIYPHSNLPWIPSDFANRSQLAASFDPECITLLETRTPSQLARALYIILIVTSLCERRPVLQKVNREIKVIK